MEKTRMGPKALLVVGVALIIFSGALIVTYIGELITGTTLHGVANQLGVITFFAGLVFVGYKMTEVQLNENKALKELKEEQIILTAAKTKGGSITVSEAALEGRINISNTKRAFERLALTGICQVDVSDEGELLYRFPSFERKQLTGA